MSMLTLPTNAPFSATRITRLSIVASTRPSTTRVSQSRISAPLSLTSGPTSRRAPSGLSLINDSRGVAAMAAAGALAVRVGWALARFCVTSSGDTAGWPTALLGGVSLPAVADVPDGVPDGVPDADAVGWAPKPTLGWTSRRAIGSLRLKTLGLLNIALLLGGVVVLRSGEG
jgi:hypothetical protein